MHALVAVATGLCVAACSTGAAGPTPSSTTTTTVTSVGIGPAPKVQHPLDPAKMIAAPCTTLTSRQAGLDDEMGAGRPVSDPDGPACAWRGTVRGITLRVTWLTGPDNTLAWMYAHWQDYSAWSPFTVSAYPGVYAATADHDADLYLAVNDKSLCRVHIDNPHAKIHPAPPDSTMSLCVNAVLANLGRG